MQAAGQERAEEEVEQRLGAGEGDTVRIGAAEFDFFDEDAEDETEDEAESPDEVEAGR